MLWYEMMRLGGCRNKQISKQRISSRRLDVGCGRDEYISRHHAATLPKNHGNVDAVDVQYVCLWRLDLLSLHLKQRCSENPKAPMLFSSISISKLTPGFLLVKYASHHIQLPKDLMYKRGFQENKNEHHEWTRLKRRYVRYILKNDIEEWRGGEGRGENRSCLAGGWRGSVEGSIDIDRAAAVLLFMSHLASSFTPSQRKRKERWNGDMLRRGRA